MKRPAPSEIAGFRRALQQRLNRLDPPERLRAIVIPSYGGARAHANLMPLLALRARLGTSACARRIARLADPFSGEGLKLVPADDEDEKAVLATVLAMHEEHALLFVGAEGEAYVNPLQRPAIVRFRSGEVSLLFDAEAPHAPSPAGPQADTKSSARWIQRALAGKTPLPSPMARLLASCLYGAGLCAAAAKRSPEASAALPCGVVKVTFR